MSDEAKKRFKVHRLPVEDAAATERQLNELVSDNQQVIGSHLVQHAHGAALIVIVEEKPAEQAIATV